MDASVPTAELSRAPEEGTDRLFLIAHVYLVIGLVLAGMSMGVWTILCQLLAIVSAGIVFVRLRDRFPAARSKWTLLYTIPVQLIYVGLTVECAQTWINASHRIVGIPAPFYLLSAGSTVGQGLLLTLLFAAVAPLLTRNGIDVPTKESVRSSLTCVGILLLAFPISLLLDVIRLL